MSICLTVSLSTMDEDLYDEFGNYIGPDIDSDASEDSDDVQQSEAANAAGTMEVDDDDQMEGDGDTTLATEVCCSARLLLTHQNIYFATCILML